MNKRGQSLSMNTIIITILVVLVLVVVAVFFAGGMSNLINKIKGVVVSSGIDVNEARLKCSSWCQKYESTGIPTYRDSFCDENLFVDLNENGKLDSNEKEVKCIDDLNVECIPIEQEEACS